MFYSMLKQTLQTSTWRLMFCKTYRGNRGENNREKRWWHRLNVSDGLFLFSCAVQHWEAHLEQWQHLRFPKQSRQSILMPLDGTSSAPLKFWDLGPDPQSSCGNQIKWLMPPTDWKILVKFNANHSFQHRCKDLSKTSMQTVQWWHLLSRRLQHKSNRHNCPSNSCIHKSGKKECGPSLSRLHFCLF